MMVIKFSTEASTENKLVKTFFPSLTGFLVLGTVFAQPAASSQADACDRAINHLSTTLQENGRMDIELSVRNNIETAPPGRPAMSIVSLGPQNPSQGEYQRIINILNSPQLLISLTRNVINNCDRVSAISYGQNSSDYVRTFGLVNGQVKFFECINSRRTNPVTPKWGQQVCI